MEDRQPLAQGECGQTQADGLAPSGLEAEVELFRPGGEVDGLYQQPLPAGCSDRRLRDELALSSLLGKFLDQIGTGQVGMLVFQPECQVRNQPIEQAAGVPQYDGRSFIRFSGQPDTVFRFVVFGSDALQFHGVN